MLYRDVEASRKLAHERVGELAADWGRAPSRAVAAGLGGDAVRKAGRARAPAAGRGPPRAARDIVARAVGTPRSDARQSADDRARREGGGMGVAPGLPRPDARRDAVRSCSRARRASGRRRCGSPPSRLRARGRSTCSPRGRPRRSTSSAMRGSATSWRTSCPPLSRRCRRLGGARSRPRCCSRVPTTPPPTPGQWPSRRTTSVRALAEDAPVLVAVDDVQWLDAPSATALSFALRRLEDHRVLCHARAPPGDRPFGGGGRARTRRGATGRRPAQPRGRPDPPQDQLDRVFPRPVLRRLHDVSGGNPFFALELARALDRTELPVDAAAPLPVPESLDRLVGDRLRALPAETGPPLLAVAALGSPATALLEALGIDAMALDPAFAAGVVERSEGEVRFTHPLLASEVYAQASPEERRAVHRRIAAAVDEPVAHARHLALALESPDEATAEILERAAGLARARGAPSVAAELAEAAARATPPGRRRPSPPTRKGGARPPRGRFRRDRLRSCARARRGRRSGRCACRGARAPRRAGERRGGRAGGGRVLPRRAARGRGRAGAAGVRPPGARPQRPDRRRTRSGGGARP